SPRRWEARLPLSSRTWPKKRKSTRHSLPNSSSWSVSSTRIESEDLPMSFLFLNHVAGGWLEAIWRASWQGGLAVLLVWMLTRAWEGMPPLLRSWLWRFVFIKFAVAFFCPIALELAWLPREAASSNAGRAGADYLPASPITHSRDKLGPDSRSADD